MREEMRFCVVVGVTLAFLNPECGFSESNRPRRPSFLDSAWLSDPRPTVYKPPPTSPEQLLEQMYEVQAQTLSILRRAEYSGDLTAALAAAWQAGVNIELIAALSRQPSENAAFQASSPTLMLAFKDGSIRAVRAYWIEGDALHFIDMEGERQKVSADLLNRDLTQRLSRRNRAGR